MGFVCTRLALMGQILHQTNMNCSTSTRSLKEFNMKVTVALGKMAVNPGTSIRILRFHIDGTLKWEPLRRATAKRNMKSQRRALTGTTEGATLRQARQVYGAVAKPAMIYVAAIWHDPFATAVTKMIPLNQLTQDPSSRTDTSGPWQELPKQRLK